MTRQNLKKDYIWNSIGVFLQNALSPVLIIIITRINGINDSGIFSFAFSIAVIFWMIGMWGGRTYQVSDSKKEFSNVDYVSTRLLLSVLMVVGAIVFSYMNNYDLTKSALIVSLVLFKAFESIADSLYGILQVKGRLFIAGKSLVYKALLGVSGFIILDYFFGNVLVASIALIIGNVIVMMIYDIPMSERAEKVRFTKDIKHYVGRALAIMRQCWPIFIVMFLTVISLNIPRYFIDRYYPMENGYFGIIAMPVTLIILVMSFILQPNVVMLSKWYTQKKYTQFKKNINKIFLVTILLSTIIFVGSWLFGVWALELIFGISFDNYLIPLLLMVIGAILNALIAIYVNVFVIMRRFKEQFYILLLTNIVLMCVAGPVVATHGLVGAIILFVTTSAVQSFLLFVYYNTYLLNKIRNDEKN